MTFKNCIIFRKDFKEEERVEKPEAASKAGKSETEESKVNETTFGDLKCKKAYIKF
jgi:hypothetical protein